MATYLTRPTDLKAEEIKELMLAFMNDEINEKVARLWLRAGHDDNVLMGSVRLWLNKDTSPAFKNRMKTMNEAERLFAGKILRSPALTKKMTIDMLAALLLSEESIEKMGTWINDRSWLQNTTQNWARPSRFKKMIQDMIGVVLLTSNSKKENSLHKMMEKMDAYGFSSYKTEVCANNFNDLNSRKILESIPVERLAELFGSVLKKTENSPFFSPGIWQSKSAKLLLNNPHFWSHPRFISVDAGFRKMWGRPLREVIFVQENCELLDDTRNRAFSGWQFKISLSQSALCAFLFNEGNPDLHLEMIWEGFLKSHERIYSNCHELEKNKCPSTSLLNQLHFKNGDELVYGEDNVLTLDRYYKLVSPELPVHIKKLIDNVPKIKQDLEKYCSGMISFDPDDTNPYKICSACNISILLPDIWKNKSLIFLFNPNRQTLDKWDEPYVDFYLRKMLEHHPDIEFDPDDDNHKVALVDFLYASENRFFRHIGMDILSTNLRADKAAAAINTPKINKSASKFRI